MQQLLSQPIAKQILPQVAAPPASFERHSKEANLFPQGSPATGSGEAELRRS